jgi:hypothetical protein
LSTSVSSLLLLLLLLVSLAAAGLTMRGAGAPSPSTRWAPAASRSFYVESILWIRWGRKTKLNRGEIWVHT